MLLHPHIIIFQYSIMPKKAMKKEVAEVVEASVAVAKAPKAVRAKKTRTVEQVEADKQKMAKLRAMIKK